MADNDNKRLHGSISIFNRKFNCVNGSNFGVGAVMELQSMGNGELKIGNSTARVGIGVSQSASYFLNVGGLSIFNEARVATDLEVVGEQLVNTRSRVFQRADANNSLNAIGEKEINFSLQTDRTTDPTTGTIALQLNDNPSSITMNRATTINQTLNVIGNTTAEATLNVWGDLNFQHSSGIKEKLNGTDYDLEIRNGDTDRDIHFIIGATGSTAELAISDGNVNLLGNLDITHSIVTTSERVKMDNPDSDG